MSGKSAYQWHQLWREGGARALASRGPSGSRCRLSPRSLEKLTAYLEQGPAAHGTSQQRAVFQRSVVGGVMGADPRERLLGVRGVVAVEQDDPVALGVECLGSAGRTPAPGSAVDDERG
ncbi:hypothetical protein ACIQCZ_37200, partial [Streptomyces sp. NPDC093149]